MITFKSFTEKTFSLLDSESFLDRRDKIRQQAQKFIGSQLDEKDVINITETAMTSTGIFSVTVWYRTKDI